MADALVAEFLQRIKVSRTLSGLYQSGLHRTLKIVTSPASWSIVMKT